MIGLVQDVFVETLAIDGKLARSIWLLLSRPGRLARRYLDGQRVRYSPPFRLYLFASVFFFFAAFWMMGDVKPLNINDLEGADPEALAAAQEEIDAAQKEVEEATGRKLPKVDLTEGEGDANEAEPDSDSDGKSFIEADWSDVDYTGPEWMEPHIKRLYEAGQRVTQDPRLFFAEARANVPRFLLLAPLIYGLTLTLLYFYRRKFFIYDHFIISLYMHAALYAYLLAALVISRIPIAGTVLWIVPIGWGVLQPALVFRQAYGSNWLSVFVKWLLSTLVYAVAFILIITLGLSYSLYQS